MTTDLDKLSNELRSKIMNLQTRPASMIVGDVRSYSEGHKQARHDATELVSKFAIQFQAAIAEANSEIERLKDGLDAIKTYGADTLSGPVGATLDTRDWQRASVAVMTQRCELLLQGLNWDAALPTPHDTKEVKG